MSIPPMPKSLKREIRNDRLYHALHALMEGRIFTTNAFEVVVQEAILTERALAHYAKDANYIDGVAMRELSDGELEEDNGRIARKALHLSDYLLSDGPLVVLPQPLEGPEPEDPNP